MNLSAQSSLAAKAGSVANSHTAKVTSSQPLDQHRHPLHTADAHRPQADRPVALLQTVDQRRHDPGSGHPERMPERDRSALRVELALDVDPELVADREDLRGERLVELDHVD